MLIKLWHCIKSPPLVKRFYKKSPPDQGRDFRMIFKALFCLSLRRILYTCLWLLETSDIDYAHSLPTCYAHRESLFTSFFDLSFESLSEKRKCSIVSTHLPFLVFSLKCDLLSLSVDHREKHRNEEIKTRKKDPRPPNSFLNWEVEIANFFHHREKIKK